MRYLILFSLFILYLAGSLAAQKSTISGYVSDADTGEKLIGASVYESSTFLGTTSNEYGFFSLTLPSGEIRLAVSYIGYNSEEFDLPNTRDTLLNIALKGTIELDEVRVVAEKQAERIEERSQMSSVELPVEQVKSLPAFMGEVDVLKALQLLPGIQSGNEGSSGLYVRGGGPDQNLILLDGVPVYNASHLFGFFSVFNADAINKVSLIKGGFPARYGGRLSSVIDIRMKEGNMKEIHGEGSIGLIASKLTLEGPIKKDKTSFIVSGRRTYIDLLARPVIKAQNDGNTAGGYYFYDINAKINHKFSDRDRLYLSGYFGRDKFYLRDKSETKTSQYEESETFNAGLKWGNATGVLRWNHLYNQKLFSNLTLTYSDYNFDVSSSYDEYYRDDDGESEEFFGLQYLSGIRDWGMKLDYDFIPSPKHYVRFGISGILHRFKPGATEYTDIRDGEENPALELSSNPIDAGEFYAYIEDDFKVGSRFKTNIGLHLSGFYVQGEFYKSLQPRFSARYLLADKWSLKASYAAMTQFIHLLSNVGVGLPTDLWVPATKQVKPQQSHQVAIGFAHTLKKDYELSVEGYYKHMNRIIEYKDGASFLEDGSSDWENKVESGKGWSYGAELFLQKKNGKTTGWVGYTLSWTERQFANLNFGESYPYRYDRRHDISVAVIHTFNDKVELSAVWVYGTGNAISLPVAQHEGLFGNQVYVYESRNGFRMNAYHRLDISATFSKKKKRYERSFVIGAYNLYSRKNPYFIYIGSDDISGDNAYKQVSLFPILPSFAYNFKF